MSDTVIRVENLGKKYIIGHQQQERYTALRDVIANGVKSVGRKLLKPVGNKKEDPAYEEFWALKDVSFEVKRGDRVGIIGKNGAGKSTLLKVLSRITEPTKGLIHIKGRVASLLEVGTGFHPELTGRENIYLNGAILGMSKVEIKKKFEEIVAFAEVEKFLDTPVKRYSSGMYVRLAFAVAAHLEPEILVVDEVLAVGDAAFQRKSLGKMGKVADSGRTVIFVSHNMAAVRSLCTKAFLLDKGQLTYQGSTESGIERYLCDIIQKAANELDTSTLKRPEHADKTLQIQRIRIGSDQQNAVVLAGKAINLELEFQVFDYLEEVAIGFAIESADNTRIFECRSSHCYGSIARIEPGKYRIHCLVEQNLLSPGIYFLSVGARCARKYLDYLPNLMNFEIYSDETVASLWLDDADGCIRIPSQWTLPIEVNRNYEKSFL